MIPRQFLGHVTMPRLQGSFIFCIFKRYGYVRGALARSEGAFAKCVMRLYVEDGWEPDEGPQRVTYRAKVKLHGTNAGVQRTPEGLLECQSRERLITPGDDHCGFARWVDSHRNEWLAGLSPGTVVFGEWGGPGVMGGVALSRIPATPSSPCWSPPRMVGEI